MRGITKNGEIVKIPYELLEEKDYVSITISKDFDFSNIKFVECDYFGTLATNEEEEKVLDELLERSKENGVETSLLSKEELLKLEPMLSNNVVGGLLAPTAGIIDPFNLCVHLMENAIDNGVTLKLEEEVTKVVKENGI